MQTKVNLTEGMYGSDNGHDFRVIDTSPGLAEIEYVEDGNTAVFQNNRFRFDGGVLKLE